MAEQALAAVGLEVQDIARMDVPEGCGPTINNLPSISREDRSQIISH